MNREQQGELAVRLRHPAAAACAASAVAAPARRTARTPWWLPAGPCVLLPPAGPPLQCWPLQHLPEHAPWQTPPADTAAPISTVSTGLPPLDRCGLALQHVVVDGTCACLAAQHVHSEASSKCSSCLKKHGAPKLFFGRCDHASGGVCRNGDCMRKSRELF